MSGEPDPKPPGHPEPSAADDESATSQPPPSAGGQDVVFVRGPTDDGRGLDILRLKNDELSMGQLREAREGQPIHGELLKLTQRKEHERLYDAEVLASAPSAKLPPARKGPPKVATDAYRDGWESIFGRRKPTSYN